PRPADAARRVRLLLRPPGRHRRAALRPAHRGVARRGVAALAGLGPGPDGAHLRGRAALAEGNLDRRRHPGRVVPRHRRACRPRGAAGRRGGRRQDQVRAVRRHPHGHRLPLPAVAGLALRVHRPLTPHALPVPAPSCHGRGAEARKGRAMVWYARSRGTAVPKWCGVVSAAFLVMAAAGPAPPRADSAGPAPQAPDGPPPGRAGPAAQAPNGMLVAESCPAPGTCMAVGSSHGPAGRSMALAELWDGSAWKALPTPNPSDGRGSVLTAVSCKSTSACTAVGSYRNGEGTAATPTEFWNGTAWRIQPSPDPAGSFGSYLTGLSCAAAPCTAVGYYQNQSYQDNPVAIAESWNGTVWTLHPAPVAGAVQSQLDAVSCTGPAACVATGSYDNSTGNQHVPLAEAWDGTNWSF